MHHVKNHDPLGNTVRKLVAGNNKNWTMLTRPKERREYVADQSYELTIQRVTKHMKMISCPERLGEPEKQEADL